jgi:hypothetical protein
MDRENMCLITTNQHNNQNGHMKDLRSGLLVGKRCEIDGFDVHDLDEIIQEGTNSQLTINWRKG